MLVFNLLMCAGLMLTLPHDSSQSCIVGTAQQCLDADFIPGTNLAGEGFDITKMERKGAFVLEMKAWKRKDETCTVCKNPYMENQLQKLPLAVLDWRALQVCKNQVTSSLHKSSESVVSSSLSSVENNWKVHLDVQAMDKSGSAMLAGTNSKLAEYSLEKTKNDRFSFTSQSLHCQYYSYRVSKTPRLHREFQNAVQNLPKNYSPSTKARFYKLIDSFGTHYITKVKLGGSIHSVTSIKQCQASLRGLSVDEVQFCLEAEASASIKQTTVKPEIKHCQKDSNKMDSSGSFADFFSDRFTEIKGGHSTVPDLLFSADKNPSAYKEWLDTVPKNPDVISYSLDSLHELLPNKDPARKNLRSAISHYILEHGLWKNCSNGCQIGVSNSKDSCACTCHNEQFVNQDCCPTRKGVSRVIITVQRASGLWGDHTTKTDGYVKVFFNGKTVYRTPVILNNNDPNWGAVVDLGSQNLHSGNKVRFEVWDQDSNWDDDLLGACDPDLSAGTTEDMCVLSHGQLFYKLEVKCGPSLGGDLCTDYKSSPMSPSLSKLYVSRHAHRIPNTILRKMGVFLNETTSLNSTNQSYYLKISL
uniref:Perforin-1-like n=1 Tax=Gouania willdenowi TaxID=441366 RepID=A0A8C5EDV2_GOUWI